MLTIGSACSGYGGLEMGLQAVVGGRVAWHVEYDKHPSAVLATRFPSVPNYGDVTMTDWSQVEPVDWLTAGYPCQPFSHAGKRKGSADERHLWPFVAAAIGALRPRRVLLENVAGHVSLGLDAVLWDLAALGYDATWGVVRAADAGAPHGRARIFILAADTRGVGPEGRAGELSGGVASDEGRLGRQTGWPLRAGDALDGGGTAADAIECGRGWPEGQQRRLGAPECVAPADDSYRVGREHPHPRQPRSATAFSSADAAVEWGAYAPAIARWERVTNRPAPRPTEPGRTGERLSPRFVEWMQGLSDGWVTDILPRNPALKALGNGVVPQQAALAVRTLLSLEREVAA